MTIVLKARRVVGWLAGLAFGLVVAHIATRLIGHHLDDFYLAGLGPLFDLDEEANLPTCYSMLTWGLAASILAGIASCERGDRARYPYWLGLSVICALLAVDEAAQIHELVGGLIETQITTSGYFYYSWIVPYAGLLVGLFLLYGRFLVGLPRHVGTMVFVAGALYAVGVIGLEAVAGRHDELYGQGTLVFGVLATFEEILEMAGLGLFVYALLAYAQQAHGGLEITIGRSRTD